VLVLGDQLDAASAALDDFDPKHDAVWMAEAKQEGAKVWSTKARIAVFLAAIVLTLQAFWRVSRPAGLLLAPYLGWVSFASYLNFTLWQLNR